MALVLPYKPRNTHLVAIGYSYGITLWDWAKLLIVPAVIAAGGLWFNTQQREREQRIAANRARDDSLQRYLDGMSQLLTDKDRPLHRAQPGDSLSTVARARTLTVLSRLDGARKRSVMEFLYESHLIERRHNIVSLQHADLRLANLAVANRSGAYLRLANLNGAQLIAANLSGADLSEASLSATPVTATQITRATLGKFEAENKGIEVESERRSADLAIVKVVIEPGGSTGWHHHPGVVLVPVKAGTGQLGE